MDGYDIQVMEVKEKIEDLKLQIKELRRRVRIYQYDITTIRRAQINSLESKYFPKDKK